MVRLAGKKKRGSEREAVTGRRRRASCKEQRGGARLNMCVAMYTVLHAGDTPQRPSDSVPTDRVGSTCDIRMCRN